MVYEEWHHKLQVHLRLEILYQPESPHSVPKASKAPKDPTLFHPNQVTEPAPAEVMDIIYLMLLLCLLFDHVWALAVRLGLA